MANKYAKILADYEMHCRSISGATEVNAFETISEKKHRIAFLEKDYVSWFEYYFPNFAKKKCAWFHKKMASLIIKNKTIRLLAEIYRSGGKSVHIDMGVPLYLYLVKQDLTFMLLIGETEPKANALLSGIQAQLQHNKRLISDYGEKFMQGDWSDGNFLTIDGIRFMALGFGQSPRGAREGANRPDYIVADDVDNKKHVNNDRMMTEAIDFITEDVWGCFDADDDAVQRFVYANNNFHKNSITNRLKQYFNRVILSEKQENSKVKSNFQVLTVCAVKDLKTFEPEWKEKNTAEYWKKLFTNSYRSFMREYMHTHIQDGAVFKQEDIVFGEVPALKDFDALCFYGDLSYKDAGDYKAMPFIGKKGRYFYVITVFLRRSTRKLLAKWLYDLYEDKSLSKYNIKYLIEGLFSMDEFVNDFDIEGDERGYYIPVVASKRGKSDKFDRVEALSGFFERRNFIFNIKEKNSPDMLTLVDQLLAFEKGSKANDDGPDALHGGVSEINRITHFDRFPAQITSRQELQYKSKNRY